MVQKYNIVVVWSEDNDITTFLLKDLSETNYEAFLKCHNVYINTNNENDDLLSALYDEFIMPDRFCKTEMNNAITDFSNINAVVVCGFGD